MAWVRVRKPVWLRQYPVSWGWIVPFDEHGNLRAGLKLVGRLRGDTTCIYTDRPSYSYPINCSAGLFCSARQAICATGEMLACPTAPGALTYSRGVLRRY